MIEGNRYQGEMARRASDSLPFVDNRMVKQVTVAIIAKAARVRTRSGEVLYPFPISPVEKMKILSRLNRPLRERVYFIPGIRMEEGVGTLIQIDKMGR